MKKFFSTLSCIFMILIMASADGSSDELTTHKQQQHLRSVSAVASEDVTTSGAHDSPNIPDFLPRELKKKKAKGNAKKPKAPKSGNKKVPKSAKGSAMVSPSSEPSSSPTDDPCVVAGISTPKDALLALKEGFDNDDTEELSDWGGDTEPCSDGWYGITCSTSGDVTEINLGKWHLLILYA